MQNTIKLSKEDRSRIMRLANSVAKWDAKQLEISYQAAKSNCLPGITAWIKQEALEIAQEIESNKNCALVYRIESIRKEKEQRATKALFSAGDLLIPNGEQLKRINSDFLKIEQA